MDHDPSTNIKHCVRGLRFRTGAKIFGGLGLLTFLGAFAFDRLGLNAAGNPSAVPGTRLVAWNNLGMHCTDGDFSVFSILPPYNVVDAQFIQGSKLIKSGANVKLTYEAIADPTGSINKSSIGKDNFWQHVPEFFGVSLPLDSGLAGFAMPGAANIAQNIPFDPTWNWWNAEGVPITPYDDAGQKNYYPMMRITARDLANNILATADVVLPVSDEMNCSSCHSSGVNIDAQPGGGWVFDPDPVIDYRLNILKLHDSKQAGDPVYAQALATKGYNPNGLYAYATVDHKAILCASCHASNALPGTGIAGIQPLTQAVHAFHANVYDPIGGGTLDDINNRSACYRCHPGSTTKCLRGAMGKAVAHDGTMSMQCQSCHSNMSFVGSANRTGWLDQPNCQNCHTGTATHNNGQILYNNAFDTNGQYRVAVDSTFATNPDTPAPGFSLYRFSTGHGGLRCEACHGSTHAEFPSSHANDNIYTNQIQGHDGMLVECNACHATTPSTVTGGPHGMHPVGQSFVDGHPDIVEIQGSAQCRLCHGNDSKGTVLSRSQANRTIATKYGTKNFWRGFTVTCYSCHNGPGSDNASPNTPAVAQGHTYNSTSDTSLPIALAATDINNNPLTYRIVSQASHGTVALSGSQAVYYPDAGFAGSDSFTFAAFDGFTDSNLATIVINVTKPSLPAGLTQFGNGTPGCSGPHDLRANVSPKIGAANFELTCTKAPPVSLGLALISDSQGTGNDPFFLGINLWVDLFAANEAWAFDMVSDGTGYALAPAEIPNNPALVGNHYYAQALFVWGWPCVPSWSHLSSSNGLEIVIQP
ncbi:MAG: hypothetical protein HY286_14840 [Planctomycetes bacterium]|nr:hypothetical protein [Planctomycetota bacterium]